MIGSKIKFWHDITHKYMFGVITQIKDEVLIVSVGNRIYNVHVQDKFTIY